MSQVNHHNITAASDKSVDSASNLQTAAERLRAALAANRAPAEFDFVRAPNQEGKPLNERTINDLLLPDSVDHDGSGTENFSPELGHLANHAHNREAKSVGDRFHGPKTYDAARAQCEPKKRKR
jgi:hypothetical protein